MSEPKELSLQEIHAFMLKNNGKVTNHDLVKHFKKFLTNPATQGEARKQFKTFVNTLSTMKNEDSEKLLVLRKKYLNKCPTDDSSFNVSAQSNNLSALDASASNPDAISAQSTPIKLTQTMVNTPYLTPPPYKPPPEVRAAAPVISVDTLSRNQYRDVVGEFQWALNAFSGKSNESEPMLVEADASDVNNSVVVQPPPDVLDAFNVVGLEAGPVITTNSSEGEVIRETSDVKQRPPALEKQISVKEATKKFNLIASEEEVKLVTSPQPKKNAAEKENKRIDELSNEQSLSSHPKSKEWIVSASNGNYQELAKLASEYPELTKLKFPGLYTALHFAAKHGNTDIVKLIAGTHKANVNARTNGGYTPLHLAMQFGRDEIFALLCNVYKADRDIADWSGNKPLDYRIIQTSVSASTYSKIKARKKPSAEKDLGFLRIGSLNVRVKKTTEAFSNFLGVGSTQTRIPAAALHQNHHHQQQQAIRSSAPPGGPYAEKKVHKYWGSADNIPHQAKHQNRGGQQQHHRQRPAAADGDGISSMMPPPKAHHHLAKKRSKRAADNSDIGFRSVPTTPNQNRANSIGTLLEDPGRTTESDSDSACGFDTNWKE